MSALDDHIAEVYDASPAADKIRRRCQKDLRYFYLNVLNQMAPPHQRGLGRIHDFGLDFGRLESLDTSGVHYSPIADYMPKRDDEGNFLTRWLYFPTLDSVPEVQDGEDGPIKDRYRSNDLWCGVIIRFAGSGDQRCQLWPRGHLKTELLVIAKPLWELIKDPSMRFLIRCETDDLAKLRIQAVMNHFSHNVAFQRLFARLQTTNPNDPWSQHALKFVSKVRRGREPSILAKGSTSAVVGFHFDSIVLDDIVGETNSASAETLAKVCKSVTLQDPLLDPGGILEDVGTVWSDMDPHALFTNDMHESYQFSSFMVMTLRDAQGKLLWPAYTEKKDRKAKAMMDAYSYGCQFYNKARLGASVKFEEEWLAECRYPGVGDTAPARVVADKKLDIRIAIDPANSVDKQSDFTAAAVVGQAPNDKEFWLLGGLRERFAPGDIEQALADLIIEWEEIAELARVSIRVGIESFSFQQFLLRSLSDELRSRKHFVRLEELKHKRRAKKDRIRKLVRPFQMGRWRIPEVAPIEGRDGTAYDLVSGVFLPEFRAFPVGTHDDFLDALAYADEMMRPAPVEADLSTSAVPMPKGVYSRAKVLEEDKTLAQTIAGSPAPTSRRGRGVFAKPSRRGGRRVAYGWKGLPIA